MKDLHYIITIFFVCCYIFGIVVWTECTSRNMQGKFDALVIECKRLEVQIQEQQETSKRILEQNIELSMRVNLKGDNK